MLHEAPANADAFTRCFFDQLNVNHGAKSAISTERDKPEWIASDGERYGNDYSSSRCQFELIDIIKSIQPCTRKQLTTYLGGGISCLHQRAIVQLIEDGIVALHDAPESGRFTGKATIEIAPLDQPANKNTDK